MIAALQVLDNFLIQYNLGQALLLGYFLLMLGSLPLASVRVLSLNTLAFGLVFLIAPISMVPFHFKLIGGIMLVLAPVLYTLSSR